MHMHKYRQRLLAVTTCLTLPSLSWAGAAGSITFAPPGATSIPTLGGIGLIILAAVVGFMAVNAFRNNATAGRMMSFTALSLGVGTIIAAAGGVVLINDARAVAPGEVFDMSEQAVQTYPLTDGELHQFNNLSNGDLAVIALSLPENCSLEGSGHVIGVPVCELGTNLADSETCQVPCLELSLGSDVRLKTDVTAVGVADNGLPLYTFRYLGDSALYRGVMAQDVLKHTPSAVVTMDSGYMAVNYTALGLEMVRVE